MRDRVTDRSFLEPGMVENPHPYFHSLRDQDPVHWSDHHQAWVLTRYEDVQAAFRDPRLSAERVDSMLPRNLSAAEREAYAPIRRFLANWMVFKNPPDHGRLRRLARSAFTARRTETLGAAIETVAAELLDRLDLAGGGDFVRDFAYPLPARVIARLLGVPAEDEDRFRDWSQEIEPIIFGGSDPGDRRRRALAALLDLESYFRRLLEHYRREPADNLLTALARAEEQGDVLSSDEIIGTCILLLFAGHETTTNLLANGVLALDRSPEEKRRLAADPGLAPSAVEELLRFEGPTKTQPRIAAEDFDLRGREIRRGQRVFLVQAAADRDPDRFPEPDRLDLTRADNDHLAFGYGIHHCLGAPLARLEGQVVFARLLERLPGLRVTVERPEWRATILSRGLRSLPVATR